MNSGTPFTPETLEIVNILNNHNCSALILYLIPEDEHPNQDLLQLLSEVASRDFLCFVCFQSDQDGVIETLGPNVFLVHHGSSVIPVLRNLSAIILTTRGIHPEWAELLPHKFLWFHSDLAADSVSNPDLGPNSDLNSIKQTKGTFSQADLISYFETEQKKELTLSSDPKYLPLKTGEKSQHNSVLVEEKLKANPKGWQVYANLNLQGKIAVMTATFLDFEGEFYYSGGAERYLLDLAELCGELGNELVVFQYGNYPWMRRLKNIDIISLSRSGQRAVGWVLQCGKAFNRIFYEQVQNRTALNIYSAFFEAWPVAATPNIGISHGVAWDNSYCTFENAIEFWAMNERHIQGAKACQELVSVDTNSANWFQTVDFDLGQRTKVIPNYVDLTQFKPRKGYLEKRDRRVVLYPRQFYMGRGLYLVLEVMDEILEQYPDVEFHFVGRGGEQDTALILEKQKRWLERVKCYSQSMEEMPQVYQSADISLIPTVHSEGTSLSCLEAMASGNAIIASRIGGLSDLIINSYNGFLIDPQPEALKKALINLLEHPQQISLFKKRNPEVAQAFSKTSWRDRWKTLIQNKLETTTGCFPSNLPRNNQTAEIILNSEPTDLAKLGEMIIRLLTEGCLVYIRSRELPDRSLSFARVQWLGPDTPLFSPCDLRIEW